MLNIGFMTRGNKKLLINDATAMLIDGFYRLLVLFQDINQDKFWFIHEHTWTPAEGGYSAPAGLVNMVNKVGKAGVINSRYWKLYRPANDSDLMPDSEFLNYSYQYHKYMDEYDQAAWEAETADDILNDRYVDERDARREI